MRIKDLPSGGSNFRANIGPGSFSKRFDSATRFGDLKNLADNRKAIAKVVKNNERAIKLGQFDRKRQIKAWNDIKKEEGSRLSKDDKKEIKAILKHLGQDKEKKVETEKKIKIQKQLDKDSSFAKERSEEIKAKIGRFSRTKTGGESTLKFASHPQEEDKDEMSMSGKILERRFLQKEKMFKERLPRYKVQWEKEKKKRFDVSSLSRDMNKKKSNSDLDKDKEEDKDNKKSPSRLFQNL
jgi:hypothetical protein